MSKNKLNRLGCYNPNLKQDENGFEDCRYCKNFGPYSKNQKSFPDKNCDDFLRMFGFIKVTKEQYDEWLSQQKLKGGIHGNT